MMLAVTFERLCIQTPAEVVCIDNPVFAFSFETSAFGKEYEVLLNSRLLLTGGGCDYELLSITGSVKNGDEPFRRSFLYWWK